MDLSATNRLISTAISVVFLGLSISFLVALYVLWRKLQHIKNEKDLKEHKFAQIFDGLKFTHRSRFYAFIFFIRKFLCILIVILAYIINSSIKLSAMLLIQIFYYVMLWWLRPYQKNEHNLIENINEATFGLAMGYLIGIQSYNSDNWSANKTNMMVYSIIFNSLIILIVTCVFMIVDFAKYLHQKCKSKSKISATLSLNKADMSHKLAKHEESKFDYIIDRPKESHEASEIMSQNSSLNRLRASPYESKVNRWRKITQDGSDFKPQKRNNDSIQSEIFFCRKCKRIRVENQYSICSN